VLGQRDAEGLEAPVQLLGVPADISDDRHRPHSTSFQGATVRRRSDKYKRGCIIGEGFGLSEHAARYRRRVARSIWSGTIAFG
jgi:hypothetical protein